MIRTALSLPLIACLTATPLLAQDVTAEPTAPAEATETVETTETVAVPPLNDLYTEEKGDWTVVCEEVLTGNNPCGSMQQVLKGEAGNDVMQIELTRFGGADRPAAIMMINTPLMTLLTEGVGLSIDGGKTARVPFFVCDNTKCLARVPLRTEDVAAFKRGNAVQLSIVPASAPDQSINTTMSLSGFTAAYDALSELGG